MNNFNEFIVNLSVKLKKFRMIFLIIFLCSLIGTTLFKNIGVLLYIDACILWITLISWRQLIEKILGERTISFLLVIQILFLLVGAVYKIIS